eukprot:233974-Pleurochrysis_carterae.AAC.1
MLERHVVVLIVEISGWLAAGAAWLIVVLCARLSWARSKAVQVSLVAPVQREQDGDDARGGRPAAAAVARRRVGAVDKRARVQLEAGRSA